MRSSLVCPAPARPLVSRPSSLIWSTLASRYEFSSPQTYFYIIANRLIDINSGFGDGLHSQRSGQYVREAHGARGRLRPLVAFLGRAFRLLLSL